MNVTVKHLRYFVAVAEELHFGHAAKRLHRERQAVHAPLMPDFSTLWGDMALVVRWP